VDTTILASVGAAVVTLLGNQWILHLQNRKDLESSKQHERDKDNRLAWLLENFPVHRHHDHTGISYPSGLDPRTK
jgi:hypothetical protein